MRTTKPLSLGSCPHYISCVLPLIQPTGSSPFLLVPMKSTARELW